jgi:predicted nuclease of predicted toxin-antitoxin system
MGMKIKLDKNMPQRLVASLTALGHDVDTVVHEKLTGEDDEKIWREAQAAGRFFITQDLIFPISADSSPAPIRACCFCECTNQVAWR